MNLKIARQIARLTQRQLASRSHVDESTISLIENGRRDYEAVNYGDVVRLARALGVDVDILFPVAEPDETHNAAAR
jgi:transcriptional regulator with XRE-family HTH domain